MDAQFNAIARGRYFTVVASTGGATLPPGPFRPRRRPSFRCSDSPTASGVLPNLGVLRLPTSFRNPVDYESGLFASFFLAKLSVQLALDVCQKQGLRAVLQIPRLRR